MNPGFSRRGFTILEVIIVLAVIMVVSLVTAPLGLQFYNGQTIVGIQGQIGDTLTRARSQSVVQKGDDQYGICLNTNGIYTQTFVLYKGAAGAACSSHNTSYDESYQVLGNTIIYLPASSTEISFAKHTGKPTATGTVSIIWNGLMRTLTVDSFGTVVEN